jgi:hydroxymethylglutaryl-CoA lyase
VRLPPRVTVVEVGPRDGLQNEAAPLSVDDRVALVDALVGAGLKVVETGAFVSPKWVPQMAGSDEVHRRAKKKAGVRLPALVPNRKGFDAARAAGVRDVALFTAASETFNKRNINASIDESFERFGEFVPDAKRDAMWLRGYISTCFGCPYEGKVAPEKVVEVAERLRALGCDELSIGDTIGVAVPSQAADVMGQLRDRLGAEVLAVHFHDTRGTALANVLASLQEGIAIVDSSAGGLGGCPYAPGASGNLATEDLLYMLHGMGVATGVDLDAVVSASRTVAERLSRALPSRYLQAAKPV